MTALVAVLVASAAILPEGPATQSTPRDLVTSSLQLYDAGDHATAVHRLQSIKDKGVAVRTFQRTAEPWIRQHTSPSRSRRTAALLALELVAADMLLHWRVHRELLDWGAAELRKEPASDFELTWLRAAAALGFRARDRMWLATDGFLVRAVKRHPDNPRLRFQLASARVMGSLSELSAVTPRDTRDLAALASDPVVGVDAEIRLAELYLVGERFDRALEHARRALYRTDHAETAYLARFIAGRALERANRVSEAASEYATALESLPNGQSATLALAAIQSTTGDASVALRRVERAVQLASNTERADPWRTLPYGEWRHLASLTDELRKALR